MGDVASRCPRWWCGEKMLVGTLCATLFAAAVSTFTYNTGGLAFLYAPPAQTAAAKEALLASIPPKANAYAEDWLIFTTVNVPSIQAKTLCAMEGWQGLVIGDKKTPDDWNAPGCIYLSIAQQEVLGYEIVKPGVLPYGRYERKNVGYLFAIERGAKRIFETDDDNIQRAAVPDVRTEHECTRRPSPSALTWNALEHFGAPQLWRRGFPLDYVKIKGVADQPLTYTESCVAFTPVHNGLADVDPDLDSVQRLTKDQTLIRNVQFDDAAPVLSFPRGTFSAWNSQNTVWHRSAFAFMVLPITTGWRVDDIWRGYWAQRMLWDIGAEIKITGATAVSIRNPHDFLWDLKEEKELLTMTSDYLLFLKGWSSQKATIFERMIDLFEGMVKGGFVQEADLTLAKAWVKDLARIGYAPPTPSEVAKLSKCGECTPLAFDANYVASILPQYKDVTSRHQVENDFVEVSAGKRDHNAL